MRYLPYIILFLFIANSCKNKQVHETEQNPQSNVQEPDSFIYADKYGNQFSSKEKLEAPEIPEEDWDYNANEAKLRRYLAQLQDTGSIQTTSGTVFSEHFFSEKELHAIFVYKVEFDSVRVEFYEHRSNTWKLLQEFPPMQNLFEAELAFADYNGDKKRDVLIYAGHGARPSNYRHNLLLLDSNRKRLIHIPKFAELPQPRYDSLENSITAVYKHGTWFSEKYIWDKNQLIMVETQSCFGGKDTLYRSINTVMDTTEIEVRVDKISFKQAKEDCYGCGPEPWDKRFGKYKK